MPGAAAGTGSGYAANAAGSAASMASRAGMVSSNINYGIGTSTAAGSAAASSAAMASASNSFNPLFSLMAIQSLGTLATSYSSAKAAKSEADFNSQIFESNARIMAIKAQDAITRGDKAALKARQATKMLIGEQRAAMGAQGIDLESGSALDIQKETASLGAEESLNIKNNAWREAWGYRVAENDLYGKAKYAKITGKNVARNTILTGGLSMAKNISYANYLDKSRNFYSQGNSGLYGEE